MFYCWIEFLDVYFEAIQRPTLILSDNLTNI